MSIRNEPDRRLVKHLLNEEMDASANQYYRQKLLELAEKCYQQLVNDCVNGILNSIPFEG